MIPSGPRGKDSSRHLTRTTMMAHPCKLFSARKVALFRKQRSLLQIKLNWSLPMIILGVSAVIRSITANFKETNSSLASSSIQARGVEELAALARWTLIKRRSISENQKSLNSFLLRRFFLLEKMHFSSSQYGKARDGPAGGRGLGCTILRRKNGLSFRISASRRFYWMPMSTTRIYGLRETESFTGLIFQRVSIAPFIRYLKTRKH